MHSAHVSFRCPFCCFHCISSCLVHDMRIVSSWNAPISSRIMHFNWKRQRDDVGTEKKKNHWYMEVGGWRCQRWADRAMTCPVRCVMYLSFFCRYQFFILSLFQIIDSVKWRRDATNDGADIPAGMSRILSGPTIIFNRRARISIMPLFRVASITEVSFYVSVADRRRLNALQHFGVICPPRRTRHVIHIHASGKNQYRQTHTHSTHNYYDYETFYFWKKQPLIQFKPQMHSEWLIIIM